MRVRRLAEPVLVLLLAVVSTTVLTHPLVARMDRVGRVNTGDGQFSIWNVAWVAHALVTDPSHVYDANIFYPHRNTLAYSEANLGAGALAIPAWWATKNPYLAHNSAVFMAFLLSVSGAYVLARHLTGHRGAATFAAIAFAFCPFIYARMAHVQLLMTAGLPWSLWACHRLVDRPTAPRGIVLGVLLAAQALSCAYYGIFAGLSVGLAVLFYAVARKLWRVPGYWTAVGVAAILSIGLVLPFFLPYLRVEGADFNRALEEAHDYSAGWSAYLASPTWAHRWMLSLLGQWKEVAFPGFLPASLAIAAFVLALTGRLRSDEPPGGTLTGAGPPPARPGETLAFYALLGGLAAWTSAGPAAGLYVLWFRAIPLFEFLRAPGRFAILVTLAIVMCAAVAVAHLSRGSGRRRWAIPALLTLLSTAELAAVPLAIPEVDPRPNPIYSVLARLPRGPVVEMPFFYRRPDFPRHTLYMLNSTAHWMPLVNGYSDHIPEDFRAMVLDMSTFPTRASFRLLRPRRARYAVLHLDLYDRRSREKLLDRLEAYREFLRPIVKHDDVWLYEIIAWPL